LPFNLSIFELVISTWRRYGLIAVLAAIGTDSLQAQEYGLTLDLCPFGLFPREGNLYIFFFFFFFCRDSGS